MGRVIGLTAIFITFLGAVGWAQSREEILAVLGYPDTVVYNAKVVTVDDETFTDDIGTIAQAMALRDGKILAVGSNDQVRALTGPQTQMIDLGGRTVVPGFITVHQHPQDWAPIVEKIMQHVVPEDLMVQRFLRGTPREQLERFPQVLAEAVQASKPGNWIRIIFFWDVEVDPEDPFTSWKGTRITKEQLDRAAPNNPLTVRSRPLVLSQGIDGMLNQRAVEVIRKEGQPVFLRSLKNLDQEEKTGVNNGLMVHRYSFPEVMLKDHFDLYTEIMRLDLSWWAGKGQTTFGTFLYHVPNVLRAYRVLDQRGQMDNRMAWGWGAIPDELWESDFQDPFLVADLATREGTGSDHIWYIGTGQNGGGCVSLEPLPTRPQGRPLVMSGGKDCVPRSFNRGGPVWNGTYKIIQAGGRLMGGHEFGDVDIDNLLDLIEQASQEAGLSIEEIRAKRHVADHMNAWPRPDQIPRIKNLGMVVGGTNLYVRQDSPRWLRDYGERALDMVVPRKSVIEAGIMNGIELDKPYENTDVTAFDALSWSITRQAIDGKVYAQNERISRELALKTATIWGAYYVLKESVLGSLETGKLADFLVLDRDYLTVPEREIEDIRILMTMVGGRVVHLVPSLARELGMSPKGAEVELGGPAAAY